jgi:hypothetical protein
MARVLRARWSVCGWGPRLLVGRGEGSGLQFCV